MIDGAAHVPVMINEVLAALSPADGEVYVDGTFGAGGYSRAFLDSSDCVVVAIDRDSEAVGRADLLKKEYGDRFVFISGCFGDAKELVRDAGIDSVNGFILDLGVSSMQIDTPERGFSFRYDGPLDMRMNQLDDRPTAADVVNSYSEEDLANIIYRFGEERRSRRIAKAIVTERKVNPFSTTAQLADLVRRFVPKSKDGIDPATRTFQALRIFVNAELEELQEALYAAEDLLDEGGRLIVVSFHSLEDGSVKRFMLDSSGGASRSSRHLPEPDVKPVVTFRLPSRKAIFPRGVHEAL
jgi:16S rRNA (cytosine1402-N4)-methyltransferase